MRSPSGVAAGQWWPSSWPWWMRAALIVAAGWYVYGPALDGSWLWDDSALVMNRDALRGPAGLLHIWTATPDWALTSTLFWLEWQLWGGVPYGYHAVNLALHLVDGLLVWRLLARLGLRQAWLGGLLFVIHPLAVESAAWISETKNTFSLLFFLLSLDAWLDYDAGRGRWSYARSLCFYLAALLAKTSVIMLPAVLLLYAWWKRGRIERREVVATAPYFSLALVLGVVTIFFQHTTGHGSAAGSAGTLLARLGGAVLALLFYLGKFIWPAGLLPVYPFWHLDVNLLLELAIPVAALILGGWWVWCRGWQRHAVLGLGFFVLNLLPVLGLVRMVYLEISPVADHFVYLPMIGLIGLAVAALDPIASALKPPGRWAGAVVLTVMLLGLDTASRAYAGLFVNHQTLWTYTLARNPEAWPAHNNLGDVFLSQGRLPEAEQEYEAALKIDPDFAGAHSNLATTLLGMGRGEEAVREYREAVRLDPTSALAHFNLGTGLAETGQTTAAIGEYEAALKIDPGNARAHNNLGRALLLSGRLDEAITEFAAALTINPAMGPAHANLGDALLQAGRPVDAIGEYEAALETEPNLAYIHYNLGNALMRTDRPMEAIAQYQEALKLDPNNALVCSNLGVALARVGRTKEAMASFAEALRIDPNLADARKNLKLLQALQKPGKK